MIMEIIYVNCTNSLVEVEITWVQDLGLHEDG
jgi:hypothetical protein